MARNVAKIPSPFPAAALSPGGIIRKVLPPGWTPIGPYGPPANGTVGPPTVNDTEKTRFRSFAERYVIERASSFKEDTEQNDAWKAILQAKTVYKMIHGIANTLTMDDEASQQAQRKLCQNLKQAAPYPNILAGAAQSQPPVVLDQWFGV